MQDARYSPVIFAKECGSDRFQKAYALFSWSHNDALRSSEQARVRKAMDSEAIILWCFCAE